MAQIAVLFIQTVENLEGSDTKYPLQTCRSLTVSVLGAGIIRIFKSIMCSHYRVPPQTQVQDTSLNSSPVGHERIRPGRTGHLSQAPFLYPKTNLAKDVSSPNHEIGIPC